ncbi:MAG: hypothetical protein AAFO04_26295, partial [Cyanobacteria bacterium J06592_8]
SLTYKYNYTRCAVFRPLSTQCPSSTANVDEVTAAPGACIRENCDRTDKKKIYQDTFRTPEYFWFSPNTLEFQGFHLVDGEYEQIEANESGGLWSKQLQLFLGIHEQQLRFFTPEGELVPSPEESAQTEKQQRETVEQQLATSEQQLATTEQQLSTTEQQLEIERQQKEKLAAKLRELNIDPETL